MTSEERKEKRYKRRKEKRMKKQIDFAKSLGTYDDVFSFENLYDAFYLCKQGVRWKASIQSYETNLLTNTYEIYDKLKQRKWKSKGFTTFKICERGKMREIQSVHISERCIQRCICDNYLVPLLSRNLIYDNGASMKGKGIDFTIKRIKKHLQDYYKHNGHKGYVLLFDFSNYFGNINHNKLFHNVDSLFHDDDIRLLYHQFVDAFDVGLGLGSQISQISAVAFANKIDHYFKDKLGVKEYARYMDDGYIIAKDIETINSYKERLYELCKTLNIKINPKKIKVCKIENGFTFLKKRIKLTDTGKIIVRLTRKTLKAARKRLKKMREYYLLGKISIREITLAYKSWRVAFKKYKNYKSFLKIDELFNKFFINSFKKGNIVDNIYF